MIDEMRLNPISQGITHQYAEYNSPFGSKESIHFPQNKKGIAISRQNAAFAASAFRIIGLMDSPLAAFSAVKGKMVNASVQDKKPAISENRVAI